MSSVFGNSYSTQALIDAFNGGDVPMESSPPTTTTAPSVPLTRAIDCSSPNPTTWAVSKPTDQNGLAEAVIKSLINPNDEKNTVIGVDGIIGGALIIGLAIEKEDDLKRVSGLVGASDLDGIVAVSSRHSLKAPENCFYGQAFVLAKSVDDKYVNAVDTLLGRDNVTMLDPKTTTKATLDNLTADATKGLITEAFHGPMPHNVAFVLLATTTFAANWGVKCKLTSYLFDGTYLNKALQFPDLTTVIHNREVKGGAVPFRTLGDATVCGFFIQPRTRQVPNDLVSIMETMYNANSPLTPLNTPSFEAKSSHKLQKLIGEIPLPKAGRNNVLGIFDQNATLSVDEFGAVASCSIAVVQHTRSPAPKLPVPPVEINGPFWFVIASVHKAGGDINIVPNFITFVTSPKIGRS
jgi:hypothetical protein